MFGYFLLISMYLKFFIILIKVFYFKTLKFKYFLNVCKLSNIKTVRVAPHTILRIV